VRCRLLAGLALLAFAGLLLYLSLAGKEHGVEVCLTFAGRSACGTAWAESREEALRGAATNACGTLARGVAETMRCSHAKPDRVRWLEARSRGAGVKSP
jgi:hypothetical protein